MIEPITPIPLFKVDISPVDWDEFDSAVIACRDLDTLKALLADFESDDDRIEFLERFSIMSGQQVSDITEIGTYTLGIPDSKEAVVVISSFNAG
jgi:hypothetical protein